MPKAYIIARRAISYRRYITRSERNGYHWKKSPLSVDKSDFFRGDPYGNRTHDSTLRGWRLSRLTNGPSAVWYYNREGGICQGLFLLFKKREGVSGLGTVLLLQHFFLCPFGLTPNFLLPLFGFLDHFLLPFTGIAHETEHVKEVQ